MAWWRLFSSKDGDVDNRDDDSDEREYTGKGHHKGAGGNHHSADEYYDSTTGLTNREVEVLRAYLALDGAKEAAEYLGISRDTVTRTVANAKEKLGFTGSSRNEVYSEYVDHFDDRLSRSDFCPGGRYADQDVDDAKPDPYGDYY